MTADEEDSGTLLLGGKRKGGKGNDGGSRVKRRVEGYGGDSGVYLPTTPKTGIVQWKSVVANEPVETSASLTFDVKASSNEIVRFGEEPWLIQYEVKRAGAAGGTVFVMPQDLTPVVYLDPFLKAGGFFSRLEVTLDGVRIQTPTDEDSTAHYQHLQRLFCTDKIRKEKYGESSNAWMSNSNDMMYVTERVAAQGAAQPFAYTAERIKYIHKNLKASMKPLMFDTLDASEPAVCSFGHDGHFPFNTQNNTMRVITGQKNSNSFLHPKLSASFVLVKRTPNMKLMIERADITAPEYFSDTDVITPPAHPSAGVTVTIKSISLIYESLLLEDVVEVSKINSKPLRYYCDMPIFRNHQLASGVTHDTQRIPLPAGTRLVYLYFAIESQFRPSSKVNSFFSSRFMFAPGLDELHLSLVGKENIVFSRGFTKLGSAGCRNSLSARVYVNELCKRGLYSKGFDDFFPVAVPPTLQADVRAFDQALVLDMTPYASDLKEIATLEVNLTYSAAARTLWNLKTICVVQVIHEYTKEKLWTVKYMT